MENIIGKLVDLSTKCESCGNPNIHLNEYNSVYNPYIARYSNHNCRKIHFLKEYSIFGHFPKTMGSTILCILKLWVFESKNAGDIYSKIVNDYSKFPLTKQKTLVILSFMRMIFAYYLKDLYKIKDISSPNQMVNLLLTNHFLLLIIIYNTG